MDYYPAMDIHCQGFPVSPSTRVKRRLPLLLFALCLLSGCWNGRLLIAVEQPFWASRNGDQQLRWPLIRAAITHGYVPRVLRIEPPQDPRSMLLRELVSHHYRAVVVSPLLSLEALAYVPSVPGTRFLLLEDHSPVQLPSNATRLVVDRVGAFRAAGRAAGLSLREESGAGIGASLAARIGILLSPVPTASPEELEAFETGVAGVLDGGAPTIRRISQSADRGALKTALEQMRLQGTEIYLFAMGEPDSWSLDILREAGGSAIVSDWAASGELPRQVFLSIESDIPRGVERFLSNGRKAQSALVVPARLVAGQARPIPAETAAEVDRK